MNANENTAVGYLPEERPGFVKLILYAIQQVIVMFPATVTVALVTGFQVSTTIFASGLATLCFILITGRKIPLYYGSSFAYLTAIASMCAAEGFEKVDGILPTEAIQYAPVRHHLLWTDLHRRGLAHQVLRQESGGDHPARLHHRPCGYDHRPDPGGQRPV